MQRGRVLIPVAIVGSVVVLVAAVAITVPAITGNGWFGDDDSGPGAAADAPPLETALAPGLLAAMQRDLDLNEREATERLRTEAWATQTNAALRDLLGEDRYAGAWLTDDGQGLGVAVTDEDAAEVVRAAGAEPTIVTNSSTVLESVMTALDSRVEEVVGALAGWHVEVATNTVVVTAPPEAEALAQEYADELDALSEVVRVVISDEQPELLQDVHGGDLYYIDGGGRCSVGFAVTGGYVTAGHCALGGSNTLGPEGSPQGEFVSASFPGVGAGGPDDWAVVALHDGWSPQPLVNDYEGGTLPVAGGAEAPVGASVCRYGATTGVSCGVIEAMDATVIYPEGTLTGLVRTSACGEPGDSGGAWLSGDQAQGVTSGGSGDCTVGGVTYFQPLNEILSRNDLTLVTTGGGSVPAPPTDVAEPPEAPGAGCDTHDYTFQGQLTAPDRLVEVQPNGQYYRTLGAGTHTVCLAGPAGTDFDLALQQWDGTEWLSVAWSTGPDESEQVAYDGTAGYYRIGIVSYGDSGGYEVGLTVS